MDITFKGIKTGAEIWSILNHEDLNESDWEKDRNYNFTQYDKVTKTGVRYSESEPIPTVEEEAYTLLISQLQEVNDLMDSKLQELADARILEDTTLVASLTTEYDLLVIQAISLEYEIETGEVL
jgi:hypothetical protein